MKTIRLVPLATLAIALLALLGSAFAGGSSVRRIGLVWTPNAEPDVGGYRLYVGPTSRVYRVIVDVGVRSNYVYETTDSCPLYFALTAYNTNGVESDFSNEAVARWPGAPGSFAMESVVFIASTNSSVTVITNWINRP